MGESHQSSFWFGFSLHALRLDLYAMLHALCSVLFLQSRFTLARRSLNVGGNHGVNEMGFCFSDLTPNASRFTTHGYGRTSEQLKGEGG
jgi:hypothetical protein